MIHHLHPRLIALYLQVKRAQAKTTDVPVNSYALSPDRVSAYLYIALIDDNTELVSPVALISAQRTEANAAFQKFHCTVTVHQTQSAATKCVQFVNVIPK